MRKFFITGTDTEIGKTYTTAALAVTAAAQGYKVACLKPVAAGAVVVDGQLKNDDAIELQTAANVHLSYSQTNPACFTEAIAPHIAAELNQQQVTVAGLVEELKIDTIDGDLVLVEGAGGWLVPLNKTESFADLPQALGCDVILVVGMRLGCINHALLTVANILSRGIRLSGWVANHIDPNMDAYRDNITTLTSHIEAPLIAEIPFNTDTTQRPVLGDVDFHRLLEG